MATKAKGSFSFKSGESVADSHQFTTMHRIFIKKLFHCTTFFSAFPFFSYGTSLVQVVSENDQTSNIRKLKIGF